MSIRFLYFDLGNVLLKFSRQRQCRQMAEVAGVSWETMHQVLYDGTLAHKIEAGLIRMRDGFEQLCDRLGSRIDYDRLLTAFNDIFSLNWPMVPLVGSLQAAGFRLGLLSNTSQGHWQFVSDGRFASLLPGPFEPLVLSYQVGAMKPDAAIFAAAADAAGVDPADIFYVDDILGHVEGARRAGFDAVQYIGTQQLAVDLRRRGLTFNY